MISLFLKKFTGMLEALKSIDENLFLFLNSHHNSFFDQVMWFFSKTTLWIPLYLWFIWVLFKYYSKHFWTVLIAILVLVTISDQCSNLMKDSVLRFRPTHEPHLRNIVHIVNGYTGGTYGFYSAHASNAFSIAFFVIFSLPKNQKWLITAALVYAVLTSYSRIYLGVHYPGDIISGALAGILLGIAIAICHAKLRKWYLKP